MTDIVYDMPFDAYRDLPGTNASRLKWLTVSPAHYHRPPPSQATSATILGSLVHTMVFEPDSLEERYVVMPDFRHDAKNVTATGKRSDSAATKYVQRCKEKFHAEHAGKEVVDASVWEQAFEMTASLMTSGDADEILSPDSGPTEVTISWDDEKTGIKCKARVDKIVPSLGVFVDLKTTSDIAGFRSSIARYKYHLQMAHYADALASAWPGTTWQPYIIALETDPPHTYQIAPLSARAVRLGVHERETLMRLLAQCIDTNTWPGPPHPAAWELPEWAYS